MLGLILVVKTTLLWLGRSLLSTIQTDGKVSPNKLGLLIATFTLYSVVLSWKFALLIMLAVGLHESGHLWAMSRMGMRHRGFYFIPFMGGVAVGTSSYKSLNDKVIVAIMGPIWGMLLALATWVLYLITNSPILGVAAYWQAMLNLFNLLPANPLDGGQIFHAVTSSISKRVSDIFGFVSILIFVGLYVILGSPIFLIGTMFSARDWWVRFKSEADTQVPLLTRSEIGQTIGSYLVLALTLFLIMSCTSVVGNNPNAILLK